MQSGGGKICFIFGQICFHATFLGGYATWLSKGRRGEAYPVRTGFSWSKFSGDLTNTARDVTSILLSMRGHNVRFVRHAKGRSDPFVCHADAKTVPPRRGDEPRRGGVGFTPTGLPDASTDNINEPEKGENHSCARETPPALWAASPARWRCFASERTIRMS